MFTTKRNHKLAIAALLTGIAMAAGTSQAQTADDGIPHLQQHGTTRQMVVDGKPFLMLGGELGNTTSSSVELAKPVWPRLARMNLNTVVLAVSWEIIEPEEGQFDFSTVDGLVQDARANNEHIVFLWFGSWKNGLSSYPPLWVKTDSKRFPWVKDKNGKSLDILSTVGGESAAADARAFAALMKHIKEFDDKHTVLMIQVENEVGVRGQPRDLSPAAVAAFNSSVPAELMDYLAAHKDALLPELKDRLAAAGNKTSGTWTEVFGPGMTTDETFQAWFYSKYVQQVAAAGKKEYPIPMYCNCWLDQGGNPGDWPSGGPVSYLLDIWKAGAPAIDVLAPDLYAGNFAERAAKYNRAGNPLFIPEANTGDMAASNALYVYGRHDAICFSPFGIERGGFGGPRGGAAAQAAPTGPDTSMTAQSYLALKNLAPAILENQGTGNIFSWILGNGALDKRESEQTTLGNYKITAKGNGQGFAGGRAVGTTGLIIKVGPDEFYILHAESTITFAPVDVAKGALVVDELDEGKFEDGKWAGQPVAVQNNDLTAAIAPSFKDFHVKLSQR